MRPKIKVLFFSTLREITGTKVIEIELPVDLTVKKLKDQLSNDYPGLFAAMDSTIVAVNRQFALDESIIPEGAEVAFFPPVSGG